MCAFVLTYNRTKNKFGLISPELYEKAQQEAAKYFSEKLKGKPCPWKGKRLPREWVEKIRENHRCWNRGKKNCYSEETLKKMSQAAKERVKRNPEIVKKAALARARNWKGKKHKPETIEKMRKAALGRPGTTTGRRWYNDGKIEKLFVPGTEPEGFKLGRLPR